MMIPTIASFFWSIFGVRNEEKAQVYLFVIAFSSYFSPISKKLEAMFMHADHNTQPPNAELGSGSLLPMRDTQYK